jgi:hypothetical protein
MEFQTNSLQKEDILLYLECNLWECDDRPCGVKVEYHGVSICELVLLGIRGSTTLQV